MKEKINAFTLIELLAVILILGIIALIAIPTVKNIMYQAKKGSLEATLNNIEKQISDNCNKELLKGDLVTTTYTINNSKISPSVNIKGNLPNGFINVNCKCKLIYNLSTNDFMANKNDYDKNYSINDNNKETIKNMWTDSKGDKITDGSKLGVGNVITIGKESFYVISNNNGIIKALAKYNLNVGKYTKPCVPEGLQDEDVLGNICTDNKKNVYGTVAFSKSVYWDKAYEQIDLNNDENVINPYLLSYKNKLENMGVKINDISLLNSSQLSNLNCDKSAKSCWKSYDWIRSSSYWVNISNDNSYYLNFVYAIYLQPTNGDPTYAYYNNYAYDLEKFFGVRPVISILVSDF